MIIYPLAPFYEWQNELFPNDLMEISPKKLTYDLFTKWSHVSFHTIAYDAFDTSIIKERDSDDEDFFKQ
jgi:hypothetical protein